MTCTRCRSRLDVAAVICEADVCTTCILAEHKRPRDEWALFLKALRESADDAGEVSQTRMRPLIAAIPHKHRGQLYRRATSLGLIEQCGWEQSTDVAGGNSDKPQRRYRLREKASA